MRIRFYIAAVLLVADIILSMVFVGAFLTRHDDIVLGTGAALTGLYAAEIVAMCFFWHRAWRSIQDGRARTTPGKAVGFMFIPVFNLYWAFVLLAGFAKDYNAFCRRHHITGRPEPLPEGYFLTVAVMWVIVVLLRWLPIIGKALGIAVILPRKGLMLIPYLPVFNTVCSILFLLAVLVLLYQTARAVTAVQNYDVVASS